MVQEEAKKRPTKQHTYLPTHPLTQRQRNYGFMDTIRSTSDINSKLKTPKELFMSSLKKYICTVQSPNTSNPSQCTKAIYVGTVDPT